MSAVEDSLIRLRRPTAPAQNARPALLGDRTLTYAELADEVDDVRGGLQALGVERGDRVAIWMAKQTRYAVAILGALHAGCAYVPLDGRQPSSRVLTILEDSEPVVLFTDRQHLTALDGEDLPASIRTIVVADDEPFDSRGKATLTSWQCFIRPATAPAPDPDIGDLAAILYTSGSTGVPKGVKISYRNLANFVGWARRELAVDSADVFANHASFNFDLSTFDLFVALSVGAAVWIVGDGEARDVAALAAGIREHGVSVWYSVPSILHLLTASGALTAETAKGLRYVLFAGEVFPAPQLAALAATLPEDTELYNLYGPTETNVCTYYQVRRSDLIRTESVPIGRPIDGATVWIADDDGRDVKDPAEIGELVVEGDCVTPGYWRREDEPAAAEHHRHRHWTGDLVSYEHGQLIYRGRRDRMVKLSGYRVELGEIEAAVSRHPDIADAAVIVTEPGPGARIALYYTVREGAQPLPLLRIKQHCAAHLPAYMVPHQAIHLDELPRNANGKTDYRRLRGQPT